MTNFSKPKDAKKKKVEEEKKEEQKQPAPPAQLQTQEVEQDEEVSAFDTIDDQPPSFGNAMQVEQNQSNPFDVSSQGITRNQGTPDFKGDLEPKSVSLDFLLKIG